MILYCQLLKAKAALEKMIADETGDTNFISIIVILGIVLGLAAVFSKNITGLVTQVWAKISQSSSTVLGSM